MRTSTTNHWVWVFAGMLPAAGLIGACGDDTAATSSTGTSSDDGSGGTGPGPGSTGSTTTSSSGGGDGGGTTTGSTSSTSSTTTSSTGTGGGGGGPTCGDGVIDDGEACEGADLGGATCEGEGFVGGDLACDAGCQLDTSGCTTCGNDTVEGDDECDGDDLAGQDCVDLGFDGGDLACARDCTFDDSACTFATCGDGTLNGNEDCEGADLGGEDCVSQGFSLGGDLACAGNCTFDTAACLTCGDDVINGDDECDGDDLGGATCLDLGFTGGTLGCDGACALDESGCTNFPLPGAGQVVFNELMINPTGADDSVGEWIELANPSATDTYQLAGCVVSTNNEAPFSITADLAIPPGGVVTLAKSAPGFTADFTYPNAFAMANGVNGDFVTLTCGGVEVDDVTYNSADGWTVPAARSLSLDPGSISAAANDDPASWCAASTTSPNFTSGDQGTPGEANPACGAGLTISECRLQFPTAIQEEEGTSVAIFGRVLVPGVTDVNQAGNDPNPNLLASVGFGPDGSDPSVDPAGWTFLAAAPNAGYMTGSPGFEPTFDEYTASFNVPPAAGSPYDFAVRFSGDGGVTWTYCDTDGSANGYLAAMAGQMVSEVSSQTFELFFSEYIEGTSNNKALEIYNIGDDVDLGACQVRVYSNANMNPGAALALSGTLVGGGTFVICHNSEADFDDGLCDLRTSANAIGFSGNDSVELLCNGVTLDIFGQIGSNVVWGTAPIDSQDSVLRRSCAVVSGDTDGTDAFDPATEWTGMDYSSATADDDLGQHVCP